MTQLDTAARLRDPLEEPKQSQPDRDQAGYIRDPLLAELPA